MDSRLAQVAKPMALAAAGAEAYWPDSRGGLRSVERADRVCSS